MAEALLQPTPQDMLGPAQIHTPPVSVNRSDQWGHSGVLKQGLDLRTTLPGHTVPRAELVGSGIY